MIQRYTLSGVSPGGTVAVHKDKRGQWVMYGDHERALYNLKAAFAGQPPEIRLGSKQLASMSECGESITWCEDKP